MAKNKKNLLLADDNDRYARILTEYFEKLGYNITRTVWGHEALAEFQKHSVDHFSVIVTDVTMESQLAGIWMLKKIHRGGFRGTVVIASTGFDVKGAITLSRLLLGGTGTDFLVPKTTVLSGDLLFYPMSFRGAPAREFSEQELSPART